MAFPGDVNSLGSVSGSQTLAAAGHATRHNEVKTALEGLRDVLGGTAVPSGTVQPILAAGSASAPSLSFTGDSNTGLWSPAADTVAFSTGGTERMRIDNAGLITGTGTSLGAWTAYTPTLGVVSGTAPDLGTGGSAVGRYVQIGKIVHVIVKIVFGTSPSAGSGIYKINLPPVNCSTSLGSYVNFGSGRIYDASATTSYVVSVFRENVAQTDVRLVADAGNVANAVPFTWAASDEINISLSYEAA